MAIKLGGVKEFVETIPFKDAVLIVGSGPSAKHAPEVVKLQPEHTVIAVNGAWKAFEDSERKPDVYMVFDMNSPKDWFWPKPDDQVAEHHLIGYEIAHKYPFDHYTFQYVPSLEGIRQRSRKLQPPILHGGGTISTCAIQLAMIYKNVRLINLIGCEMSKDEWWNSPLVGSRLRKPRACVRSVDFLVELCRNPNYNIKVNHVGFSFIQCPQVAVKDFK